MWVKARKLEMGVGGILSGGSGGSNRTNRTLRPKGSSGEWENREMRQERGWENQPKFKRHKFKIFLKRKSECLGAQRGMYRK